MKDIKIVFEDRDFLVLDKPPGILVHPTEAKEKGILTDFLKNQIPGIENLDWPDKNRPGIVHRLDKDTSGLIIVAKTPGILEKLQNQFRKRTVSKIYHALVLGQVSPKKGKIETQIGRHRKLDKQSATSMVFSWTKGKTRPAVTDYKTLDNFNFKNEKLTYLETKPQTGRMHQIRVHLKYIGNPIIGDPIYHTKLSKKISSTLGLSRQFLHATQLKFIHPETGEKLVFVSPLSEDLKEALAKLQKERNFK